MKRLFYKIVFNYTLYFFYIYLADKILRARTRANYEI